MNFIFTSLSALLWLIPSAILTISIILNLIAILSDEWWMGKGIRIGLSQLCIHDRCQAMMKQEAAEVDHGVRFFQGGHTDPLSEDHLENIFTPGFFQVGLATFILSLGFEILALFTTLLHLYFDRIYTIAGTMSTTIALAMIIRLGGLYAIEIGTSMHPDYFVKHFDYTLIFQSYGSAYWTALTGNLLSLVSISAYDFVAEFMSHQHDDLDKTVYFDIIRYLKKGNLDAAESENKDKAIGNQNVSTG